MPIPKKPRPSTNLSRSEQAAEDRFNESVRQYSDISEQARNKAEAYYRNSEFLCSEAVFSVVNDYLGQPVDARVVKIASGFPVGIGMSGCLCGAVAGGVMALGLKHGREQPGEALSEAIFPLSAELHDRFQRRNGSNCCRKLIRNLEFGSDEHIQQCIRFTGEVVADVVDLMENGIGGSVPCKESSASDCEGCSENISG